MHEIQNMGDHDQDFFVPPEGGGETEERDIFDGHYEKLDQDYKQHRENFDIVVFIIGFLLFFAIYKLMQKYDLN